MEILPSFFEAIGEKKSLLHPMWKNEISYVQVS